MSQTYPTFLARIMEINQFAAIQELLDWDQETQMPPKGAAARAEEVALLAGWAHQRLTDPALGELIDELAGASLDDAGRTNVRDTRRQRDRAVKMPTDLVKEIAHTTILAKGAWVEARSKSDFAMFAPWLQKMVELKTKAATLIGYEEEPYDALMDEYEPGARTSMLVPVFEELKAKLVPLVQAIAHAPRRPDPSILHRRFPRPQQEQLGIECIKAMGFDFDAGRLDVSAHPFCSGSGPDDVRITTRYDEGYLPAAVFGMMHEAGHALYEQGFEPEYRFTSMAKAISLGIHESQSRLWENIVGRSRQFWSFFYPRAQELFPEALKGVSLDQFHHAINNVAPSFIRVEADEITYNLHIILRFDIERRLISGDLPVKDVPSVWNKKMKDLVGVAPSNDREGCLQDIHWSMGTFGYFPTYTLGNLYAAQFFAAVQKQMPGIWSSIERGDMSPLRSWLREHIHIHGRRYLAHELVQNITGQPLTVGPFMDYVNAKFRPIYGL